MDDQNMALNQESGEVTTVTSTPEVENQATEEVVETTETTAVDSDVETDESDGDDLKKGYSARVRELNARAKKAESENLSLQKRIAELTGNSSHGSMDLYAPQFEEGKEYAPDQLRQEMQRTAISAAQLIAAQQNNINRINNEVIEVTGIYKQLDPENDLYDEDLSEAVTEAVESYIKANPTKSVKEYVGKLMKPYQRSVTTQVNQERTELARQVSQSAQRPTAPIKAEKSFHEKSLKEMEAELGFVQ